MLIPSLSNQKSGHDITVYICVLSIRPIADNYFGIICGGRVWFNLSKLVPH